MEDIALQIYILAVLKMAAFTVTAHFLSSVYRILYFRRISGYFEKYHIYWRVSDVYLWFILNTIKSVKPVYNINIIER